MAKGEIARFEQFLLSSLFSKSHLLQRRQKASIRGKGLIIHLPITFEPTHSVSGGYRVMIPETENPQEAKSVCPAKADLGRYITQIQQCWFSHGTAHLYSDLTT